jgi:nicotinate phosphoribosyltransferase
VTGALSTDLYQLTMMAGYVRNGLTGRATFELFVRRLPPHRKYLICAGLGDAIDYLEQLRFTADDIAYLRTVPALSGADPSFFDRYLLNFRFTGDVHAMPEGTVAFEDEPLLQVVAPLPEAQLVETALLAIVSFQTSVASRASRVVRAAENRPVIEFGARRAHGPEAGALAARAAYLAGCVATSNLDAGHRWHIPVSGTMAHSWVLAHASETEAFRSFAALYGERAVLLIDTYDTIAAVDRVIAAGLRPAAVRLDSGDLAGLAREVRLRLDRAELTDTQIIGSGDLDEQKIRALLQSGAPFDGFGVGSSISAVTDLPSLSAVYKLVSVEQDGRGRGVMKRSSGKATMPGRKQVWRVSEHGTAELDIIGLHDEPPPVGNPLLVTVMKNGSRCATLEDLPQARERCRQSVSAMPADVTDVEGERRYPIERSSGLDALTAALIAQPPAPESQR